MVLQKTQKLALISRISAEMQSDVLSAVMLQAIIEPLVIAKIKAAMLQLPLEIPVGFRDKEEILVCFLDCGNNRLPVFLGWAIAGSLSPSALKDLVQ